MNINNTENTISDYYTEIGNGGVILHTFTMGEILIAVLLFITVIILLMNMNNKN